MLSMSRRAWIALLSELVCERENVLVCLSVWLSGGCSNSSVVLLHLSWKGDSCELCVIKSLEFLWKPSVWSLGEGQPPEELDKPIETPPLSTLLIEKPQSATVSVGELTIPHTRTTSRCWWPQAANGSTSRCRELSPGDRTVSDSAIWNKRKTFPPYYPHSYLCDVQKWAEWVGKLILHKQASQSSDCFWTSLSNTSCTFQCSADD